MAGVLVTTWANPRSKVVVGKKGSAALATLWQSGLQVGGPNGAQIWPTGYTNTICSPHDSPCRSPITGGIGYSVDTRNYVGPVPIPQGQPTTGMESNVGVPQGSLAFSVRFGSTALPYRIGVHHISGNLAYQPLVQKRVNPCRSTFFRTRLTNVKPSFNSSALCRNCSLSRRSTSETLWPGTS